jgi:hypothetical protein
MGNAGARCSAWVLNARLQFQSSVLSTSSSYLMYLSLFTMKNAKGKTR